MSLDVGTLLAHLKLDTANYDLKLAQAKSHFKAAGPALESLGRGATYGVTLPLIGAGVAAFKFSMQFDAAMANVATLLPGNVARVNQLKSAVQDMAVTTGKSTDDLAGGLYQVLSAFGDTAETAKDLEINAKAAAAGLATTTDAINLTSAVTKGYGDTSAKAIQQSADLALLTVRLGQTTFPELAASIGQVIPLAQNLGITQQEVFATMATFTGVTGHASEVATQFRGALQSLLAPTDQATAALKRHGFASGAAAVKALGIAGATRLLVDEAKRTGVPLQTMISSIEGQTYALGISGAQAKDYSAKLAQMRDAAGTTDKAFKEVSEGTNAAGFAWEQAKAKAQVLAEKAGDALAPALVAVLGAVTPLVDSLGKLADWFSKLDTTTQHWIVGLVGVAVSIGPIVTLTIKVVSLFETLVTVGRAVGSAIGFINAMIAANPVGALVIGLILLIGALIYVYNHSERFRKIVHAALHAVGAAALWVYHSALLPMGHGAVAVFKWIIAAALWFYHHALLPIGHAGQWVAGKVVLAFHGIGIAIAWLTDKFRAGYNFIYAWSVRIVQGVTGLFHGITSSVSNAWHGALAFFRRGINGLIDMVNSAIGFINSKIINTLNIVPGVNFAHIPSIPHLAGGGTVYPVPGGRQVIMGDGGEVEYGIPRSHLRSIIREAIGATRGTGGDNEIRIVISGTGILRGIRKAARTQGGKANVLVGV